MIYDRQQTLQNVYRFVILVSLLKKVYKNRSAEERRQLSLLVSHDKTWQKHRSSSLYALGVCIDVATCLVIDYELILQFTNFVKIKNRKVARENSGHNGWHIISSMSCQP